MFIADLVWFPAAYIYRDVFCIILEVGTTTIAPNVPTTTQAPTTTTITPTTQGADTTLQGDHIHVLFLYVH